MSKRHEKIMRKLEYRKGFTFYSWKNTGAVTMLMMGRKPMRYISKMMGHHSLDMTDKYFQSLGVDEMEEAIIFPSLRLNTRENVSNDLAKCSYESLSFRNKVT
jgi:integrase